MQKVLQNPYILLCTATWFWAGNTIAGRLAVDQISPIALTSLRWFVVLICLLPFVAKDLTRSWSELKPFTWKITWMGSLGFTGFSFFIYQAAHSTGAANISIIQGITPAIVLVGAFLFYKIHVTYQQILGVCLAFWGIITIGIKGDINHLKALHFSIGDLWMIAASTLYAVYTLGLRNKPPLKALTFFFALAIAAFISSLFLFGWEIFNHGFQWPTQQGWLVLFYIALFPSLLSQICYIRGVELIGPARAGLFVNLIPIFGTLMAAHTPNEPFGMYHITGLCLVLGGIILAEWEKIFSKQQLRK